MGVVLGSLLLRWFVAQQKEVAEALVNVDVGAECVILVSLHWYRVWRAKGELPPYRPSAVKSTLVGMFAGVSSTLAHAAGPIIALYLLPQRLDRQLFVGTCAIYFFILNNAKLPAYYLSGLFGNVSWRQTAQLAPLLLVGALVGFWLNKRMNDRVFSKVVYTITFVLGWYILLDGAAALLRHVRAGAG